MAIDSRDKRASCIGLTAPNHARIFGNPPDYINNQADRQHDAYTYRGILASAPSAFNPAWALNSTVTIPAISPQPVLR